MKLSEELKWRGFVNQTTYKNIDILDSNPVSFYFGVDPSADSMTIGNLASAMMVRHFINAGHKAYLLVGGATGLIGDPDGKKDERNLKAIEEISRNKASIASQYKNLFSGSNFEIVDNYDWFKDINYLDFLRNVGKHVPISQMLGRDFVQSRLGAEGSGISYAEFSYSLIQGYDYLHLFREHGVTLQVCGADQWGNSLAGVDLIRRIEGAEVDVYSVPLVVNKATGVKFGKSEEGAIWLDEAKTSVYKFYQFWLNVDDEGVIDYMKIYTMLNKDEIENYSNLKNLNPSLRQAQIALAKEVTRSVHGETRLANVEKVTNVLFSDIHVNELSEDELEMLSNEVPNYKLGNNAIDYLLNSGIVTSKSEARRLIEAGAISINNIKLTTDIVVSEKSIIKKGKNSFVLVC